MFHRAFRIILGVVKATAVFLLIFFLSAVGRGIACAAMEPAQVRRAPANDPVVNRAPQRSSDASVEAKPSLPATAQTPLTPKTVLQTDEPPAATQHPAVPSEVETVARTETHAPVLQEPSRAVRPDWTDEDSAEFARIQAEMASSLLRVLLSPAEQSRFHASLAQHFGESRSPFRGREFEPTQRQLLGQIVGEEQAAAYAQYEAAVREQTFQSQVADLTLSIKEHAKLPAEHDAALVSAVADAAERTRDATEYFDRLLSATELSSKGGDSSDSAIVISAAQLAFQHLNAFTGSQVLSAIGDGLTDEQRKSVVEYLASEDAATERLLPVTDAVDPGATARQDAVNR